MRKYFMACLVALALAAPAAADGPLRRGKIAEYTPPAGQSFQWTGLYVDGGLGGALSTAELSSKEDSLLTGSELSLLGEVRLGFDWRPSSSNFVLGVFASYGFGTASSEFFGGEGIAVEVTPSWGLGARAGLVGPGQGLYYVGWQVKWSEIEVVAAGDTLLSRTRMGHGPLAGIQWPIMQNLTIGPEYSYTLNDNTSFEGVNVEPDVHALMVRGSLRFPAL